MQVMPGYLEIAAITFHSNHIQYRNRIGCTLCTACDPILSNFALRSGALKVVHIFALQPLCEPLLFGNLQILLHILYTCRQSSAFSMLHESVYILDADW